MRQGVCFPVSLPKYRKHFFCSRNSMANNSTLVNTESAVHQAGQGGVNTTMWEGRCPHSANREKTGNGSPCILPKLHLRPMESY